LSWFYPLLSWLHKALLPIQLRNKHTCGYILVLKKILRGQSRFITGSVTSTDPHNNSFSPICLTLLISPHTSSKQ
jgi:hypothetical protein